MTWSAQQYDRFEDERTQPVRDLLAAIPRAVARIAVDLGCGPGNSTEVLAARYPMATVRGLDRGRHDPRERRGQRGFFPAKPGKSTLTPASAICVNTQSYVLLHTPQRCFGPAGFTRSTGCLHHIVSGSLIAGLGSARTGAGVGSAHVRFRHPVLAVNWAWEGQ